MKFFLSSIAAITVFVAPRGAAFTLTPKNGSNNIKPQVSTSGAEPLAAFRFPSMIAEPTKQEPIQAVPASSMSGSLFEPVTDVCVLALRLATCALMIHHGIDKIEHVDGFSTNVVSKFFGFLPGDPSFWTLSAAVTQIGGSALLAPGFLSRPVAFSMMMTMVVAVVFHLLNTGLEGFPLAVVSQHSYNYELAALYVGVLAYFSASGAGKYSVDEKVLGGELELYDKALGKVFDAFNDADEKQESLVLEQEKKTPFKMPW